MKLSAQAAGALSRPEELVGLRPDIDASIKASLHMCLTKTNLGLGKRTVGKARDTYEVGDKLVIVTTDRQSAFDRILAAIPFKGQVLNQTSAWWMRGTQHIAPNALLAVPDPNVSVMRRCQVFPVEFVVRGYLTGYTATSLWTHYSAGAREYCGNSFSDGMRKNDRLEANVVTPTTKAADHDKPIAPQDIVARGLMSQADWDQVSATALALFEHGQREGRAAYWLADSYAERHAAGQEPQSIDKEFLRLWFRANCDPYADAELPAAPEELVVELARRYVLLYETITGQRFEPAP
ncbi:hypothetical protein WJX81_003176, partial [Elliptochloris bilobata]